jgi:hypothetical protein
VELLTPSDGQKIEVWEEYKVTWVSQGVCIDHVELSYRVEDGSWQTIGGNLPDTGSYSWTLPVYNVNCFLRIDIYDSANNILCSDTNGFTVAGRYEPCL